MKDYSDYIKIIDCEEVDEFWGMISPIGDLFNYKYSIFRGQGDSSWELVPRIFRKGEIDVYSSFFLYETHDYVVQASIEIEILTRFIEFCDSKGLIIPSDSLEFREYLERISAISLANYPNWPNSKIIPLMALAQHHGVPTRLLDVTHHPYVAAYFAASSAMKMAKSPDKRFSFFAFHANALANHFALKSHRVPTSISQNISAQSGEFIVVPNDGAAGEDFVFGVSVENYISSAFRYVSEDFKLEDVHPLIYKITLPNHFAPHILSRCARFGISAATIFPGYDGAAAATQESFLISRGIADYMFT